MLKINYKNPFFVFGVIVVLFFGSWLFLGSKKNLSFQENNSFFEEEKNSAKPEVNFNAGKGSSLKWIEELNPNSSDLKSSDSDFRSSTGNNNSLNLTDLVSQNLASEFLSKVDFSQIKKSPKNFTQQLQSINLNSFDVEKILKENPLGFVRDIKEIDETQLKIIQDNSSETIQKYGREYGLIFSQAGGSLANDLDKFSDLLLNPESPQNSSQLKQIISDLKQGEEKLKNLPVPSSLVSFHKRTLAFIKNFLVFLEAIVTGEDDPVRAYLAVKDGFSIISSDINYLDREFKRLSQRYNF